MPLDPEIQKMMYQQKMSNWINSIAQGLMQMGNSREGVVPGLLKAVAGANTGQSNPMDALNMQMRMEQLSSGRAEREAAEKQRIAQERLMSSPEVRAMFPTRTGVEAGPPGGSGLMQDIFAADPGAAMNMVMERLGPSEPKTAKDAAGYLRYLTGSQAGERAFPGVEKPMTATERAAREPKTSKDAAGYLRYTTGSQRGQRVFPNVEKPASEPQTAKDAAGYLRFVQSGERVFPDVAKTPETSTAPMKDALALGLQPGTPEYNDYIRERTLRAQTDVDVNLDGIVGELGEQMTKSQAGQRLVDLEDRRVAAAQMAAQGANLIGNLVEGGDKAISWTGKLARGLETLSYQTAALADSVGFDIDPERFTFSGNLAGESSVIQSQMLGLAAAVTKADQGAKPSDFDVQMSLNRIGSSSGSSNTMARTIKSMLDEKMNDFAIDYRVRSGEEFDWGQELERHGIEFPELPTEAPEITQDDIEQEMQRRGLLPGG